MTEERMPDPVAEELLTKLIKVIEEVTHRTTLTDLYQEIVFGSKSSDDITILIGFIIDMFRSSALLGMIPRNMVKDIFETNPLLMPEVNDV